MRVQSIQKKSTANVSDSQLHILHFIIWYHSDHVFYRRTNWGQWRQFPDRTYHPTWQNFRLQI